MAWIFQYDSASLGTVINRLIMTNVWNVPRKTIPRLDGVRSPKSNRLERRIQMNGRVTGNDADAAQTALNSLQAVINDPTAQGEKQLFLHDNRFINAKVTGTQVTHIPGVAQTAVDVSITMLATHPFFIDTASFSDTQSISTGTFSFSVVNTATAPTPFRAEFKAKTASFIGAAKLENLTSGDAFTCTHSTTAGDQIDINTASKTVVDSAGTSIVEDFTGVFWNLLPGSNSIVFTGSENNLDITFNPRYDA